jgi:surfeit locus 1 family protein
MKRYIGPIIIGGVGCAILLSLGIWQVQRLAWKEAMLAEIEQQIRAEPVPLFDQPLEEFQPVTALGEILGPEAHVLTSRKPEGVGFRVVSVFETEGRRILLDRGFVPEAEKDAPRPPTSVQISANFRTVDEKDAFTPEPDLAANFWFARDVPQLAAALGTEPILLILRDTSEPDPPVRPWPVDTAGISNNHLEYAVTWFSLALVWAGMTAFLLWRIRARKA